MARGTFARRGRREVDLSGGRLSDIVRRGFMARLAPDLAEELLVSARSASYPTGTIIASSLEQPGPAILMSGCLRSFLSVLDGRHATMRCLPPGDLAGRPRRQQANVTA